MMSMVNTKRRRHTAQMGVAKPDFLRCVRADEILIENAERFARIDLDLSDFEKECTQCTTLMVSNQRGLSSW